MAFTFSVKIDHAAIVGIMQRLSPAEMEKRLHAAMTESVHLAVRRVVSRTPKKTGALAASIGGEVQSSVRGVVKTGLHYAQFVEEDTKPHLIGPVRKKALFWPGARHPVRRVMHPGTRGKHMFGATAKELGPLVGPIFAKHLGAP